MSNFETFLGRVDRRALLSCTWLGARAALSMPSSSSSAQDTPLLKNPAQADLLVSELFVSLQGEGVSCGAPASFLRLARCNLACGFCDTPYSWDFERYEFEAEVQSRSQVELAAWVEAECPGRLIVTGGEPLIQQKALAGLLHRLEKRAALPFVEIETNGTIVPSQELARRVRQYNVSIKLKNSGEPESRRLKANALRWFAGEETAYFKFVVREKADVEEALGLVGDFAVPRERVLLMPEARTVEELDQRSAPVARWALEEGVRFSSRLHLRLYGGRRGT